MKTPAKTHVLAGFSPTPVQPLTRAMVNSDQRLVFAILSSNGLGLKFVNGILKRIDAALKLPDPFFKHVINEALS